MCQSNDTTGMDLPDAHSSWKGWFQTYGPRLLLFARQQTRSQSDAEDVLQDAVIRLWRQYRDGNLPHDSAAYKTIRRSAIDLARKNSRRLAREKAADEIWGRNLYVFELPLEDSERKKMIEFSYMRLPQEQQEVLTLKIWGDLTFEQISHVLDISRNTAASRYRYALSSLRKSLESVLQT